MLPKYKFLTRFFVVSLFLISYFFVKFVLIHLSQAEDIQLNELMNERRSFKDLTMEPANFYTKTERQYVPVKQKPLYQQETQTLESTFRNRVAAFYEKYNKVYKPFVVDDKGHGNHENEQNKTYAGNKRNGEFTSSVKDFCGSPTDLLIVVSSSPHNIKRRLTIRYSWAENHRVARSTRSSKTAARENSQVLFTMGTTQNKKIRSMIEMEMAEYKDIIFLEDIQDNYKNLATKTMKTLEWIFEHCNAYFVLKTDDDCFVNQSNLLEFLQRQGTKDPLYAGRVQWSMPAIRDRESKFYVPHSVHKDFYLHPYASGGGYVISWNLLQALLSKSKTLKTIPIEDANVGNVLHSMGVNPSDIQDFLPFIYCNTSSVWERPPCDYVRPYVMHGIDSYGQLWMHYHVAVLSRIPSICKHDNKHRHKLNPPYYCPVDLSM